MGLSFAENTRPLCRNCWHLPSRAALLFAVGLIGCNNTCFTFSSNPPSGAIGIKASDLKPPCTLTRVNGATRLKMQTVPQCSSCPESFRIEHIFVTIRSIEAHSNSIAGDDSLDWQELAPQLAMEPLQVDLVRGRTDQRTMELLGESVALPAGAYHQVRVRFVPNPLGTNDRLLERNACGSAGFNCVVMADGTVQPFQFDTTSPELRITSDKIEGGSLLIFPDTDNDLLIELRPVWKWFSSANQGLRLLPALTGSAKVDRVEFNELGTSEEGVVRDSLSR